MCRSIVRLVACVAIMFGVSASSFAGPVYTFFLLTGNGNTNVGGQLSMEVNAGGPGVTFTFRNDVGVASSITDIYFDDGSLLAGPTVVSQSAGVSFSPSATPPNLPGGNLASPPFVVTAGFSADSDPPAQPNGINAASEFLVLGFTLQGGQTVADVINELASGALRVGLHVQAIAPQGGSDSYLNNTTPIPLPAAAWMGMALMGSVGGAGYFRRRRQARLA